MIVKRMKNIILGLLLIISICNITFSAIVSDSDGSAFISKADFEDLKDNFNKQIDNYNESLDNKIDGAIASYLAGRAGARVIQINLYDRFNVKFGSYIDYATTDMVAFRLEGESVWSNTCPVEVDGVVGQYAFRLRRMMIDSTPLNMDLENGNKGSTIYNGNKGQYLYVKKCDRGYELKSYWTNYIIYHVFTGSFTNSPAYTVTGTSTWDAITPFRNLSKFGTEIMQWGPRNPGIGDIFANCVHISNVYKSHDKDDVDTYFCNTLPTESRICITDENEDKIKDYHQGTVSTSNSTWGWVRAVGSKMANITLPSADKIKYYLKEPVTTSLVPANNFIYSDLSDYIEKKVLLTDGAPFVKADREGTLMFKLKFSCNTTGKTVKFGLNKNTPYSNNNTINTNITDINLNASDFNYNCDTGKTLDVKFEVQKDDIIYLKVDTQGLLYDSGAKTYFVTPKITDLYIAE